MTWAHFKQLIPLKDSMQREFYAEMCRVEGWSTRALAQKIDGMLFERTALSKKPEALIRKELAALREKGELSPALVFRDPYMLDFLELADTYSEKDLESAILREIERFLLEIGAGFAFVERQKRITLDGDDYYLDLLFFHRRMQRLVAIELKIGDFKPRTRARWSCTCGGSIGTSASPPSRPRWGSSCARARSARRSSTWISARGASTSPST